MLFVEELVHGGGEGAAGRKIAKQGRQTKSKLEFQKGCQCAFGHSQKRLFVVLGGLEAHFGDPAGQSELAVLLVVLVALLAVIVAVFCLF